MLVDDKTAVMTLESFNQLNNYSCSAPSGAFEGKRWRSADRFDRQEPYDKWWLKEFVATDDPKMLATKIREILLIK